MHASTRTNGFFRQKVTKLSPLFNPNIAKSLWMPVRTISFIPESINLKFEEPVQKSSCGPMRIKRNNEVRFKPY